jgi:septum formation protein
VNGAGDSFAGLMTKQMIWLGSPPILASRSLGRRELLEAAGIYPEIAPSLVDERAVESAFVHAGGAPEKIAGVLARAKAIEVSGRRAGALCIGADQTLTLHGEALHQSLTIEAASEQMKRLSRQTHILTSAVCVACDGAPLFEAEDRAAMTMRRLDDRAIERYFAVAGPAVLGSVGLYQIEGLGVHLFEKISGDHATIVGLPLLPLLAWLRRNGSLAL